MLIFKLFLVSFVTQQTFGQLTFGANGVQVPPINLFSVYYAMRRVFNSLVYSDPSRSEKPKKKETKGRTDHDDAVLSNETSKSSIDDLVLDHVMSQLNVTCLQDVNSCEGMTLEEMAKKAGISLDEEDLLRLIEKRAGVNFSPLEILKPEEKSPALLPNPTLRSSGWYGLYWAVFGVLLGLYLLLGVPYFLTGMTVQEAEAEEAAVIKEREEAEAAALNISSYMTYGESDMMMNRILEEGLDFFNQTETAEDEIQEKSENPERVIDVKGKKTNGKIERNWVVMKKGKNGRYSMDSENGVIGTNEDFHFKKIGSFEEMNELKRRSGIALEESTDKGNKIEASKGNIIMKGVKEAGENNKMKDFKGKEGKKGKKGKEGNKCTEQMLCLRPLFGARAISVSRFALNILDWIPGLGPVTEALNQRLNRLTEAVEDGRQLSCRKYKCR